MNAGVARRTFMVATALAAAGLAFRAAVRSVAGQGESPATPDAASAPNHATPFTDAAPAISPAQRRTVLHFFADWCVLCQRAQPSVTRLQAAYQDAVNFARVDIDTAEGRELGLRYKVPFIPAFVVLDASGAFDAMYYAPAEVLRAPAPQAAEPPLPEGSN